MSFMDKIKFWSKNDDLGLEDNFPKEEQNVDLADQLGLEPIKDDLSVNSHEGSVDNPISFQEKSSFNANTHVQDFQQNKDLELISSKLDTIKAELDSISQRVQRIEKIVEPGQKDEKKNPVW
ncbi:MAG: hypothetical protein KKF89_03860 [Nanoarchaeota archaeon]|nr:hypothetical protein [Nanoarchaeota archaeon]MBU1854832.1 hypothetical protein [Nanoarchaeota archaeon]